MTQKLLLAIPAALSLAACGGGGDDDVTTVPAQAQYSDTTSAPNWTTKLPANLHLSREGRDKCHLQSKSCECGIQAMEFHACGA